MDDSTHRAGDDLSVELWVRRPVCGPRTTVIDRLSSLQAEGSITDMSVTTWPEEVPLAGDSCEEVLATVDRLEAWAERNGLSLRPPFETRIASLLVGESHEVLMTPMMVLAVSSDDELVGVYPCTDGERTWTIPECLDALEATGSLPTPDDDSPSTVDSTV